MIFGELNHSNKNYNITTKLTQCQPSNLLTSEACSIILCTHVNDAMKPLKCIEMCPQHYGRMLTMNQSLNKEFLMLNIPWWNLITRVRNLHSQWHLNKKKKLTALEMQSAKLCAQFHSVECWTCPRRRSGFWTTCRKQKTPLQQLQTHLFHPIYNRKATLITFIGAFSA